MEVPDPHCIQLNMGTCHEFASLVSEIIRRLPASYLKRDVDFDLWLLPPKHIPFPRPSSFTYKKWYFSPLNVLVNEIASRTEKAEPFHSDNAPSTLQLSSSPFAGRLSIDPHACNKADRKTLVIDQRIWLSSRKGRNTLCVFTDGSKTHKAAGWAITGIHAGITLFSFKLRFAIKASAHDAEMMALAHASKLILETMLGKPDIREFRIFSDSTAALTSIFDPAPHAMQQASLMFRSIMLKIFSSLPYVSGEVLWTPGHGGLDPMIITDSNAKSAANSRLPLVFPLFVSRSAALSDIEVLALREWHAHLDSLEDSKSGIFRPSSGFKPFADDLRSSVFGKTRPAKWFKNISRPLMSRLSQMCTNHAPTGEYFKRSVWKYHDRPPPFFMCSCKDTHSYPPTLQTRDHIIRACPLYDDARDKLRKVFPRIDNPRVTLAKLVRKQTIGPTLDFLFSGPFSRKHAPYEPP